ncbi:hypothetical protein [Tsukamurella sp. PLM1]|uniref:hypothetical protein n=1 Tax=Tsukamurella sp. PLM1 TaxID=2929795 RepID=UPI00205D8F81|nr:hypothetical protein [Tsukamurella sp. PLM1]BDH56698.1 hypothetical protein MTP03_16370 [Tsukamurella sp. PLM1]
MATRISSFRVDLDGVKTLVTGVSRVDDVEYTPDGERRRTEVRDASGVQKVDEFGEPIWVQKMETINGREVPVWKIDILMKYKEHGVTYSDTYGIKVPYDGDAEVLEDRDVRFENLRVGQFNGNFTFKATAVELVQPASRPSVKPEVKPNA